MRLIPQKKCNFKTRQRRTPNARFQPLICARLTRFVWLAERRPVAHNPSLARQASVDAK
jgi:hypothetical protein